MADSGQLIAWPGEPVVVVRQRFFKWSFPRSYRRLLGRVFTTCHSPVCGSRWVINGLLLRGLLQGLAMMLLVSKLFP